MAAIRFADIKKTYPGGSAAVSDLDLEVADGELLVLVGPSGCGKSTVLRLIAGLETPTSGRVFLGEQDVTDTPPQDRDVAMVFQSYALYPHMRVRENMGFGLRIRGVAPTVINERVANVARVLGIEALLERKPAQLSGGQRQRVALGRAIVREPQAFLLDEPLSNLDVQLRLQTRAELLRLHRRLGVTMLYVTHDQEEAMTLGQRIAVLHQLQQVAPPLEVYHRPANLFVAGFLGSPTMNVFRGALQERGGKTRFHCSAFSVTIRDAQKEAASNKDLVLGVRPQDLLVVNLQAADVSARVDVIEPRGNELVVHLELGEGSGRQALTAVVPPEAKVAVGDQLGLRFQYDHLHFFAADSGQRLELMAQPTHNPPPERGEGQYAPRG
jgi:multiple sugar transport system ATP-binding protein